MKSSEGNRHAETGIWIDKEWTGVVKRGKYLSLTLSKPGTEKVSASDVFNS